jgi:hypothetical protein
MNAIYFQFCNRHTLSVVDYLDKKHQWNPVYIGGLGAEDDDIIAKYKSCIYQDSMSIRKSIFDYTKIGAMIPVDAEIIRSLSPYIVNSLGFQEDATGFNFPFLERRRGFYDVLNYWNTVILNLKPEIVVFFTRPHTPAEYPLYLLCKYYYNINILYIDPTPFFDQNSHIIGSSLEEPYIPFLDIYRSDNVVTPSSYLSQHLEKNSKNKVITPLYIKKVFNESHGEFLRLIKSIIPIFISGIIRLDLFKAGFLALKINKNPYNSVQSRVSKISYIYHTVGLYINNSALHKYYKKKSTRIIDFNKKYVYFSASYQPEATTTVMAGPYVDQFLVIDILCNAIPDDWLIYYKEHPSIFIKNRKGSLARNKNYYDRLISNKKIRLVPAVVSNTTLIDNSRLTATIGGTAGWESIVRGKSAISFGSSWVHGCNSIFHVKTLQDVKSAIKDVMNGYEPDKDDIIRYAASIEKVALKGMIHREFDKNINNSKNPRKEMERISDAIYQEYIRLYEKNF